ncbi:MAG: hypothetical protein U0234_15090 [Sandaracinus sp.]
MERGASLTRAIVVLSLTTACGGASSAAHSSAPLVPARVHGIAAGASHACARHADGTVSCWGDGGEGQLGDGHRSVRTTPVVVLGLEGVEELAAGAQHTCARDGTGHVLCWGSRHRGQIGDGGPPGDAEPALHPVHVRDLDGVVQISAGDAHTCAVRADGSVLCWGDDLHGQLGRGGEGGPDALSPAPVRVEGIDDAVEVRAGGAHTCARRRTGEVLCWGGGAAGQTGELAASASVLARPIAVAGLVDAVELTLGDHHACARHGRGLVACWGGNERGQLGDGTREARATPVDVAGLEGVEEIDAGRAHTCARLASSEVRCWGDNRDGQLGDGSLEPRLTPGRASATALQVAAGGAHTCALDDRGAVHCWGSNAVGQLGDGRRVVAPRAVRALGVAHASAVRAAGDDTCAREGDRWSCWGDAASGQLGPDVTAARTSPALVSSVPAGADLLLAPGRACALVAGRASCWGGAGAVLDAAPREVATAVRVLAPSSAFTCAIAEDASVLCWGQGTHGELGRGAARSDPTPLHVDGALAAVSLTVGEQHACAALADGHVRCWGSNASGQLGVSGTEDRLSPVEVAGISDARAVVAGLAHTCALHMNGAVSCWGAGRDGQLGAGAAVASETPLQVRGLSGIVEVVAGVAHTCARGSGGEVWCWGANRWGQLAADDPEPHATPVRVEGVVATGLAAGSTHTCALVEGGVACWGSDASGQLGDGATLTSSTPVLVAFGGAAARAVDDRPE